jgi:hypothetical protein
MLNHTGSKKAACLETGMQLFLGRITQQSAASMRRKEILLRD